MIFPDRVCFTREAAIVAYCRWRHLFIFIAESTTRYKTKVTLSMAPSFLNPIFSLFQVSRVDRIVCIRNTHCVYNIMHVKQKILVLRVRMFIHIIMIHLWNLKIKCFKITHNAPFCTLINATNICMSFVCLIKFATEIQINCHGYLWSSNRNYFKTCVNIELKLKFYVRVSWKLLIN